MSELKKLVVLKWLHSCSNSKARIRVLGDQFQEESSPILKHFAVSLVFDLKRH